MRIEALKNDRVNDFINYCKIHRESINTPYLTDEELANFIVNEESPTYLLLNEKNTIIGVASLVLDKYHRMEKVGRFRILHSVNSSDYKLLLSTIKANVDGLNQFVIFADDKNEKQREILDDLGFYVDSFLFCMVRRDKELKEVSFPEGFELRTFKRNQDEEDWCKIRNIGFGSDQSRMTPETVSIYWENDIGHLEGGMMLLYHNDKPVGTVRTSIEKEDDQSYAYISVVCVDPEYRKKGFGRNLIRAAIQFGIENNLPNAMLEVHTDNKNALNLYINEGFETLHGDVCYMLDLK